MLKRSEVPYAIVPSAFRNVAQGCLLSIANLHASRLPPKLLCHFPADGTEPGLVRWCIPRRLGVEVLISDTLTGTRQRL
jgi:hypothetical protein